ncbi:MAG TPA: phosphomannomutase/phosphoglucomutase [Actinomycetota bacterium]|nr:phosphomannomutase/phosphoglucomutase [Actinomycetota bacterium]
MGRNLEGIFKAYDIRGIYPSELDEEIAYRIGAAFARFVGADRIAVGRDMRVSSPSLAEAFSKGVCDSGRKVIDLGEVSTDALYFASGRLNVPGAMFTASHNPAEYNGIKLCREQAIPVGSDTGMAEIRALAESDEEIAPEGPPGTIESRDILEEYSRHCRSFIDPSVLKPLKIAIDAGNGMAGKTVPIVFSELPFEVVPLFFELDGTFPNHPANPIEAENLVDLQKAVVDEGCVAGLAFDGDADRVFLVDEKAEPVTGSLTTALVAERLLKKNPGETVLYNLICSRVVPEVIKENGGVPVRTRVGHSFIKKIMAETGAIFGGEHSGHYYFRDNFRADSGMIAALIALEAMSEASKPLSELLKPFKRYFNSGEINSVVKDQQAVLKKLAAKYSDGEQDWTDGLTVDYPDWWFNCRASNTEPLLRLNLEANTEDLMQEKRDEVLALIREES